MVLMTMSSQENSVGYMSDSVCFSVGLNEEILVIACDINPAIKS